MTAGPAGDGRARLAATLLAAAALFAVVAAPFFAATTFIGDDHLFLAFSRYAPNPLVAFVRDQHGGEYYRPLPMLAWWVLGRVGGGSALPFAALALGLHAVAAALLGALLVSLGRTREVAALAAGLFFVAPQNLETALWFSASTDLFAAVFGLGALVALARNRIAASTILTAAACFSKESAFVLPLLGVLVAPRRIRSVAPPLAVVVAVAALRHHVLSGWGGAGDAGASALVRLAQMVSGLVHVWPGADVLRDSVAWVAGGAILVALLVSAGRRARREGAVVWAPFAFAATAVAPAFAAGWVVGARYFYLPAAGLAWAAAEALVAAGPVARTATLVALIAIGGAQAGARRPAIVAHERRLSAARRAVAEGAAGGHRVFHVASGIKDLDLAIKEDAALAGEADRILVLCDVPASFALIPPELEAAAQLVVASPPLPPSGAYRFGGRRIVGLARRDDDPDLSEVVRRFPDIRFIRLRASTEGPVQVRDVTDELKRGLE